MALFGLLPPQASSIAPDVDALLLAWTGACAVVAFGIFGLMIGFAVHFRRGVERDRAPGRGLHHPDLHHAIEWAWILTPLAIFIAMFVWAADLYAKLYEPPGDALRVSIVAKQWMWKAQHPTGRREIDTLHVPLGRPVELVMTSEDAIHSFFVPAFRIKHDVLPGRYTTLWFTATQEGTFHLFCAEYCGTDHARMGGSIVVMPPARFSAWLAEGDPVGMAARGAERFRQYGCSGCHDDRSTVHAPSLRGLFGKPVALADGRSAIADETYLRDAIVLPGKDVVAGYEAIMPSYEGRLAEDEILDLIAYIHSLPAEP